MNINILSKDKLNTENNEVEVLFASNSNDINNSILNDIYFESGQIHEIRIFSKIEKRIFICGLKKNEILNIEYIGKISAKLMRKLKKYGFEKYNFTNLSEIGFEKNQIKALIEGLILGDYDFDKYKTEKTPATKISEINIYLDEIEDINIDEVKNISKCIKITKDLVNEPANFMYPETLASEVEKLGKENGFITEIYCEDEIKNLKMGAFMAVAKGSNNKPRLIVMKYYGDPNSKKRIGFVGKGITYDSGGFSLKKSESMLHMKNDMGGAAAVIGAMCAIAKNKVKKNVIAVVPACENIISSKAYKPGDIVTSMSGKTIEVLNTDCEGRMTLIDGVHYIIDRENVDEVITIATLTGAAVTALGNIATPVVSNNDNLFNKLDKSSYISCEKIWRMPNYPEYRELIIGDNADLKNMSGRHGGCITAGMFIGEFAGNIPWAHLDIAGTVFLKEKDKFGEKGATGIGTKLLYNFANL